jgi:hypothetical protein
MAPFRYAYNALVYFGEDIADSIDRVARFGYDAIEVVGEPTSLDAKQIKRLADNAGIAVSSVCSIYTAERDLAHPDPAVRTSTVQYVKDVADFAAAMGAETVIVHPTACMKTQALASAADERRWAVEGIRAAGSTRRPRGQPLARVLEPLRNLLHESPRAGGEPMARDRPDQRRHPGRHVPHEPRRGVDPGGVPPTRLNVAARPPGGFQPGGARGRAPGFRPDRPGARRRRLPRYLSFELLPASADPFGAMKAGGQEAFFDRYTEQAIRYMKAVEAQVAAA